MNSLHRKRRRQVVAIVLPVVLLAGMVVVNVLRPSPEEAQATDFTSNVLSGDMGKMSAAEREDLRRQWERFSPSTRRQVFLEISRARLDEMREEAKNLTPEERSVRVQKAVEEIRKHRQAVSPEEREKIRERLATPEAKEMIQNAMDFYRNELTARERAELDPLMHEWLYELEQMMGR